MARKSTQNDLPYLSIQMRSKEKLLLSVKSTKAVTPAPFQTQFGATMRIEAGTDRLAVATTLVEVARDLLQDDDHLHKWLTDTARTMVKEQLRAADRFVMPDLEDLPF